MVSEKHFFETDILLPDFGKTSGTLWSVVACDQYTSEPEYWKETEEKVGDAPSTLNLILPEVYLGGADERIPRINAEMDNYIKNVLSEHKNSMIYVERTLSSGKTRRGLVGAVDLEDYDFSKGSQSLIRATEGTVLSRIPPRVKIRENAPLELPHILMLADDAEKTVIEPLSGKKGGFEKAYDFDLMQSGGHVAGYFVPENEQRRIDEALRNLMTAESMKKRYGIDCAPLLFAVGDGNHSLATAKACYEKLKEKLGDKAKELPARYALVEIENLHDDALEFEPIYRVVFGVDPENVKRGLCAYADSLSGSEAPQSMEIISADGEENFTFMNPEAQLTVGTLQNFLDKYVSEHEGAEIDYIHGEESLKKLAKKPNAVGFLFGGMKKDQLFKTVICDGALPRKTFSMGHANDKRFYLECRKIK